MLELYKLYKLSRQYNDAGNYTQAEYALLYMIRLKTELLGRNYAGCSFDLYSLGLINTALNKYDRARRFLIRALQIQKSHKEMSRLINVSQTLQMLAGLRREKRANYFVAEAA